MSTLASDTEMPDRPAQSPFRVNDEWSETNYVWLHGDPDDKWLDGLMDSLRRFVNLGRPASETPDQWTVCTRKVGHTLLAQVQDGFVPQKFFGRITSMTSAEAPGVFDPWYRYEYQDEAYRIDLDEPAKLTDAA
jgi:hypothetical protein